jgi:hypothetical protein
MIEGIDLKHFLSFQRLDPTTRLFSLISALPGTARQYQNPRTVPPVDKVFCQCQLRQIFELGMGMALP